MELLLDFVRSEKRVHEAASNRGDLKAVATTNCHWQFLRKRAAAGGMSNFIKVKRHLAVSRGVDADKLQLA